MVDVPQNALFKLLNIFDLNTEFIDEELPEHVVDIVGSCLTTVSLVRLELEKHNMNTDDYFKAKSYVSNIDTIIGPKDNRCPILVSFPSSVRKSLKYKDIKINNPDNAWVINLVEAFTDAVQGKTVYGFSDESLLNVNIARQKIGLSLIELLKKSTPPS